MYICSNLLLKTVEYCMGGAVCHRCQLLFYCRPRYMFHMNYDQYKVLTLYYVTVNLAMS